MATPLKAYKGTGKMRVKFTPGKEAEIRNMLTIGDDYKLFDYAKVTKADFFDLKRAGLATLTDGQEKVFLKGKQKLELNGEISKPEILLPDKGILISSFTKEVSNIIKEKDVLFYRIDQKEIVEIGKIKHHKTGKDVYTGFICMEPNRFITLIENYLTPGQKETGREKGETYFLKRSMKRELWR